MTLISITYFNGEKSHKFSMIKYQFNKILHNFDKNWRFFNNT